MLSKIKQSQAKLIGAKIIDGKQNKKDLDNDDTGKEGMANLLRKGSVLTKSAELESIRMPPSLTF